MEEKLPSPKEIQFDDTRVRVLWSDDHQSVYSNKKLRDGCPCAMCKGERGILGELYMPATTTEPPQDVRVVRYSLVGRYAVSFTWSDGHSTGIYPFDYLLGLCECGRCAGKG